MGHRLKQCPGDPLAECSLLTTTPPLKSSERRVPSWAAQKNGRPDGFCFDFAPDQVGSQGRRSSGPSAQAHCPLVLLPGMGTREKRVPVNHKRHSAPTPKGERAGDGIGAQHHPPSPSPSPSHQCPAWEGGGAELYRGAWLPLGEPVPALAACCQAGPGGPAELWSPCRHQSGR